MESIPINTEGHCFLCIKEINCDEAKIQSLRLLCRYFNLKVENFISKIDEGSKKQKDLSAQVTLCEKCEQIVSRMSNLYQLLETFGMEMDGLVESIQNRILQIAVDFELRDKYLERTSKDVACKMQAECADRLRNAIWTKCSFHSANTMPRVAIRPLNIPKPEMIDEEDNEIFYFSSDTPSNNNCELQPAPISEISSNLQNTEEAILFTENNLDYQQKGEILKAKNIEEIKCIDNNLGLILNNHSNLISPESVSSKREYSSKKNPYSTPRKNYSYSREESQRRWGLLVERYSEKTDNVNFKCKSCQRGFDNESSFRTHLGSVHKYFKHKCKYCMERFRNANLLKRHTENDHKRIITYLCEKVSGGKAKLRFRRV